MLHLRLWTTRCFQKSNKQRSKIAHFFNVIIRSDPRALQRNSILVPPDEKLTVVEACSFPKRLSILRS
ncbi:hypothetical protein ACTXT7_010316 [Hymenolepis weldensis]